MAYEDLDAGDETRRNGDYVAFDHPDGAGTDLSGVTIARGEPVTYDGTDLALASGDDSDDLAGVLANYEVSGDTGKETVGAEANVKVRGEVIADLSTFVDSSSVSAGTPIGNSGSIYPVEEVDASNNLWRVQVR